ncbi:MAG TPA: polymer-forming cytoskeletal protein [Actinomycetota bacterium]|nr:polymer-forming cytoskeletal protein [Actinomycetota bacterium]
MATARHRSVRIATVVAMTLAAGLALAAPAAAQTTDVNDDDQVVLNGRLIVPSGETVGSAVLFNGTATIDGTVEESLVVLNGDAVVSGTVRQDVVALNGDVRITSGAEVGGDLVTRSEPVVDEGATVRGERRQVSWELDATDVGVASRIVWWIGYSVSALVLGLVMLLLAPGLDAAVAGIVRTRIGAAFGFGALMFFALPIVAVLAIATVVGLPLGLFMLLAFALLYTIAYVIGAHAIGRLVVKPPASRYVAFLAGLAIVRLLALIPVVGGLTWFVVTLFGFGIAFAAMRAGRADARTASPAPPVPPAPPLAEGRA